MSAQVTVQPGVQSGPGARRAYPRAATVAVYALAGVALFAVYLRLSVTSPENSDMANILFMASDLRHGNLLLHGWYMSDTSFYTTELPQYALLESVLGVHMATAHVAAAMTYTLVFLLTVMLARSGASGRTAAVRTLIAAGIMIAPQLGQGVYALDVAVGHIGTSVPLLLVWLLLDKAGRRWWVAPAVAVLLAWALVADPIVLAVGIAPLALVSGFRVISGGRVRRFEMSLFGAAIAAAGMGWAAGRLLHVLGGYVVNSVRWHERTLSPHDLDRIGRALRNVLELFGANFYGLSGVQLGLAVLHLASVAVVVWALLRAARRFPTRLALVDQVLAVAITVLVAAYLATSLSRQGAHEIAIAAPFAAALAARVLVEPAVVLTAAVRRAVTAGVVVGALVLVGYTAGLGYEINAPKATAPRYAQLASWLADHGLTRGLAGYWDSSSITMRTEGRVTVRALRRKTMKRDDWMSEGKWYDPRSQRATFIVQDSGPHFTGWRWGQIERYFGQPASVYLVGPFTIFVYHKNLLPDIPR